MCSVRKIYCSKCGRQGLDAIDFFWTIGRHDKKPVRSEFCIKCTTPLNAEPLAEKPENQPFIWSELKEGENPAIHQFVTAMRF